MVQPSAANAMTPPKNCYLAPMKPERKAFWKKWLRRMAWLPLLVLVFLALLEIFYRNQWIDTYRRELNALNLAPTPAHPSKKVLVMGDSFTAATNSWVETLRKQHPDHLYINSAVPGTTIFQANLMLARRLEAFQPDALIYQVYVGNDLFDMRYPTNWAEIGWGRNLYWLAANHVRSLAWVNYSLGQFKRAAQLPDFQQGKVDEGTFQPEKYSERERLYLQAEPGLIADQVRLQGDRGADMADYMDLMTEFLATAKTYNCPVIVLIVPHCAQVDARYAAHMKQIGAQGMEDADLQLEEFPFFKTISTLEGNGVHFINLLPDLQAAEQSGQSMYYLHDAHLNDAGQEVLADAVDCEW